MSELIESLNTSYTLAGKHASYLYNTEFATFQGPWPFKKLISVHSDLMITDRIHKNFTRPQNKAPNLGNFLLFTYDSSATHNNHNHIAGAMVEVVNCFRFLELQIWQPHLNHNHWLHSEEGTFSTVSEEVWRGQTNACELLPQHHWECHHWRHHRLVRQHQITEQEGYL